MPNNFFNKFKRHPPVPAGTYFAQLSVNAIDLTDEVFAGALAQTQNGQETFPNLSLDDLKTFWETLQYHVATPEGRNIPLGVINYVTVNRKDHVTLTGLTLEPATITPDSDNFVVETVRSTLNDEETRLSEDITYQDIQESLQQLITATLATTDFTADDLPKLPTEETYLAAVQANQLLIVERQGLVAGRGLQMGAPTPSAAPTSEENSSASATTAGAEQVDPSSQLKPAIAGDDQPSDAKPKADIVNSASTQTTTPAADVLHAQQESKVLAIDRPTTQQDNTSDSLLQQVATYHLKAPQLPVDQTLIDQHVVAANEHYVASELARSTKRKDCQ